MAMTRRELLMILGIGVASLSIANKALAKPKHPAVEYLEHITVNDLNYGINNMKYYQTKYGRGFGDDICKLLAEKNISMKEMRKIVEEKVYANKGKLTAAQEELLWSRSRKLCRMTLLNLISV